MPIKKSAIKEVFCRVGVYEKALEAINKTKINITVDIAIVIRDLEIFV